MKIQTLLFIGAIWFVPIKVQAQEDPQTETKTPKKLIIDEDIDKYIGKKPIEPKGNSLGFDFAAFPREGKL